MKLVASLCFAVSLFLTVNQPSSAQPPQQNRPGDKSQAQNGAGQSNSQQVWENLVAQNALTGYGPSWFSASYQGSGMSLASADDVVRDHLKLPKGQGLVVTALDGNSPAAHAGIQLNDVLLILGETPLAKPEDLDESAKKVGEEPALLFLLRGGKQHKFMVRPQIRVTLGPAQPKPAEHEYWIGVSVSAIEPVLRSQLQISPDAGLIVNEVVNDSPAEKAGVKVHDILLELDGKPLSDPPNLAKYVQTHGKNPIVARLLRGGEGQKNWTVEVTPEQRKTPSVALEADSARSFYFLRPGAVLTEPAQAQEKRAADMVYALTADSSVNNLVTYYDALGQKPAEDANAAVAKRLDALDAEIKHLRKAVEEISKAEKIIAELNRAVEALNKATKDKK